MKQHKFNTYAPKMPPKRKLSHLLQVYFAITTTMYQKMKLLATMRFLALVPRQFPTLAFWTRLFLVQ